MPQSDYDARKTTSIVRLNSKLSAANLEHLEDGGVDIAEGIFIAEDTDGKAKIATASEQSVFLNFLDTDNQTVRDNQKDYFDSTAPELPAQGGGLTGIIGSNVPIGLHKSLWDVQGTPARGDLVIVGTGGKPKNQPYASIGANTPYFGVIHRIRGEYLWFLFTSTGRVKGS